MKGEGDARAWYCVVGEKTGLRGDFEIGTLELASAGRKAGALRRRRPPAPAPALASPAGSGALEGLGAANRLCGKGGRYDRLISTYLKSDVKQRFFEQADGLPERRVGALRWWQLAQQRAHWKTFVDSISLY